jgi:glucose-6-phosphate 1-dehydrogenase
MNRDPQHSRNTPTIMVAFGATGDLMKIKVIPALFQLYLRDQLPVMFRFIGFSRRDWSDEQFRKYIYEVVTSHAKGAPKEHIASFLESFQFTSGDFSNKESYFDLKRTIQRIDALWGVCSNKLFYLAVAPEFYKPISDDLVRSELTSTCDSEDGWTHVVVEKPFGKNGETAMHLEELLGKLFEEKQIYRIDHYPAKEMLQNILTFRFANNLFEAAWGNELIESIHIRLLEKVGAEKRGPFYDKVGALRDVGQNHFLQMLALITMERPTAFSAEAIREKRADILETLDVMGPGVVPLKTFRAQYKGYREIKGVAPDSITETYFRIHAALSAPRWRGVPITMEGGKRLGEPLKEIVIRLRHPEPCLCPPGQEHYQNEIVIRMEPKEEIHIRFTAKKPGLAFETELRELSFLLRKHDSLPQYTEEYERLLLDCIHSNQTLFISQREVRAMWRYIDPIISVWEEGVEKIPLHVYEPDTKDITQTN